MYRLQVRKKITFTVKTYTTLQYIDDHLLIIFCLLILPICHVSLQIITTLKVLTYQMRVPTEIEMVIK